MVAVALVAGGSMDTMDGAVAQLTGRVSRFGALLDSTLDRYCEALVLTSLGYVMAKHGRPIGVVLVLVTLFGSVMVSYTRARAEGIGVDIKIGLMTRVERVCIMILMLLTRQILIGLWILAILTQVTVIQRMWFAYRALKYE